MIHLLEQEMREDVVGKLEGVAALLVGRAFDKIELFEVGDLACDGGGELRIIGWVWQF